MKIKILLWILGFMAPGVFAQEKITVFFDFDQFLLTDAANAQLQLWAAAANEVEVSKIYGFCDWKGSNSYNDSLSVKRVNTVFSFLKSKNINVKKGYEIRGFGEDFDQSKIQSENRKVTILYDINKEVKVQPALQDDGSLPLQEKIKIAKVGDKIKLRNINFFNMTPRILPKSKTLLFELLCALQDNPKLKIEIQGHICCQLGNNDINGLSSARAKVIYNFLIVNKINRNRLSYKGFGTTNPIYPIPEKSEKEEEENRRVEILILEN